MFWIRWRMSLLLLLLVTTGCAANIPTEDIERVTDLSQPQSYNTLFRERFESLRKLINKGLSKTVYVQVEAWEALYREETKSEMILGDLPERVVGSVNYLTGDRFRSVSYDRGLWITLLDRGKLPSGELTPTLPDIGVQVSLIGYDEGIERRGSGCDFGLFIPAVIEGEDVDGDLMAECEKAESVSRIAIDLRLKDYKTREFLPQMQVSNMILVFEMERESSWGLMVYGSGFSRTEKIEVQQGLHQAVKNLIDYSVLELFSMYFNIPFWKVLQGEVAEQQEKKWLANWRKNFLELGSTQKVSGQQRRIGQIQHWLTKYDNLAPAYVNNALVNQIPRPEYGAFGQVTQAFALKFLYQYIPESTLIQALESNSLSPQELADLYISLIQHIPIHDEQQATQVSDNRSTGNSSIKSDPQIAFQLKGWDSLEEYVFAIAKDTVQYTTRNNVTDEEKASLQQKLTLLTTMLPSYYDQKLYPSSEAYKAFEFILQTIQHIAGHLIDEETVSPKRADIAFLQQALYDYRSKSQHSLKALFPTHTSTITQRLQLASNHEISLANLREMVKNYPSLIKSNPSAKALSIFARDSSRINAKAYPLLHEYGQALKDVLQDSVFLIACHTDETGSTEYNQRLSEDRAQAIKYFLVSNYGIESARLLTVGYGETFQMVSNETKQGKIINRRVEFINLGHVPSQGTSSDTSVASVMNN